MATDRRGGWGDLRATGSGGARSDAQPTNLRADVCPWLEFTFFNKGYDGRGRGGFVPPDGPSGPPSHDMRKTFFPRGAKVVSPRDGRDVVRGRTEAFHRVERCAKIDKQAPQRPRRVRAR